MMALMGLIGYPGRVRAKKLRFMGHDLLGLADRDRRRLVGKDMAMIFQEPTTSLNPCFTIGWQLVEQLRQHSPLDRKAAWNHAVELLEQVGIPAAASRMNDYPHQMSGGMRKRLALAQTLIMRPDILLMDEPFSALDVQTRQLMENELLALWAEDRKSVLFITHDLEEAIALSDRVVVLSAGPGTRPIGDFRIDLPRPRDVSEIRMTPDFLALHREIWAAMKEEVLKAYARQKAA